MVEIKKNFMTLITTIIMLELVFAQDWHMMDNWYWYGGLGIFSMIFMILLVFGVPILLIFLLLKFAASENKTKDEDSISVAKKRYAKGEITKKEFEEIKRELKK